jgi:hypothetical protein
VIESGQVTTFFGNPVTWQLDCGARLFRVEISFVEDDSSDAPHAQTHQEQDGIRLVLTNFGGTSGRGSAQPVLLGEIASDLLFLHFRTFRYGKSLDYTVHYTFSGRPNELWAGLPAQPPPRICNG